MKDVSFYIIHNDSKDRSDLRNRIKNLAKKLNIDLFEIYKQSNNLKIKFTFNHKLRMLRIYFLRFFYNLKHKKEFSFNFYSLLFKSLLNFNKSIINLIFKNANENKMDYKHIMIESLVTKKHIKAWKHFLKSKKEIMVIFEDDAICKTDSEKRLKDFFVKLNSFDFNYIFIDLAGGLNLEDVIPKKKIKESKYDFMIVDGIYTNTACSYLITRSLTKILYEEYQKSNLNNSFPIDHLINKLGLNLKKSHNISSIHFSNPLFTHGSFKGNIKSWQNY